VQSEILRAMSRWSSAAKISFHEAASPTALRTVNIRFARGTHDDAYPFDGPGGALAHAFYPAPPNPESLAGDLHFDEDETWRIAVSVDLFSVALHELGHTLGLGHSDKPGSVMYPYYSQWTTLTDEDIGAIRELYADPDPAVSTPQAPAAQPALTMNVQPPPSTVLSDSVTLLGTISGGTAPFTLEWATDRGYKAGMIALSTWSAEIPLQTGVNRISLTVSDANGSSVSQSYSVERMTPPPAISLVVTSPSSSTGFSVTQPSITIRGTASHASGIVRIAWSSDRGPYGTASGASAWDTGAVPLQSGANVITIRATARDGSSATTSVQVMYSAASSSDTTAPALAVASPSASVMTTTSDSIVIKGTAKDNVGVAEVAWSASTGPSGKAAGTTSWTTPAIPLLRGYNSIIIRAFDGAGNMSWRSVSVTRQ
jgi:hypothetical protein